MSKRSRIDSFGSRSSKDRKTAWLVRGRLFPGLDRFLPCRDGRAMNARALRSARCRDGERQRRARRAILIATGVYQWTSPKAVCLTQCQSPLLFLMRHGGFRGVPTANPNPLTPIANRLILAPDERSLRIDLVRLDRTVQVAGCVGSRDPGRSTPTQRAAAQIPEAIGVGHYWPPGVCGALSCSSWSIGRTENSQAADGDPLAPRWFPNLLALEVPPARRLAKDAGGHSPAHSRHERREPALGSTADPRRTAQAWHRCRTDHRGKIHGEAKAATVAGLADPS